MALPIHVPLLYMLSSILNDFNSSLSVIITSLSITSTVPLNPPLTSAFINFLASSLTLYLLSPTILLMIGLLRHIVYQFH